MKRRITIAFLAILFCFFIAIIHFFASDVQCSSNSDCGQEGFTGIPFNVALNKPVFATHNDNSILSINYKPEYAVDGDALTSWNAGMLPTTANLTIELLLSHTIINYTLICEGVYGGNVGKIYFYDSSNNLLVQKSYVNCKNGIPINYVFGSLLHNVRKIIISGTQNVDNVHINEFYAYGVVEGETLFQQGYCSNGDVFHDYRKLICNNPGTALSFCSSSIITKVQDECGLIETCSNGECITTQCTDGNDNDNDFLIDSEDPGCWDNPLDSDSYNPLRDNEASSGMVCISNAQCGKDGYTGNNYCMNNDVYQDYKTFICNNPGT